MERRFGEMNGETESLAPVKMVRDAHPTGHGPLQGAYHAPFNR